MTSRTTTATSATTGIKTTRTTIAPSEDRPPTLNDVPVGLKRGSSGAEVVAVQEALARHFPARVSGTFDQDTEKQLRQFQKDNGLVITGVADEATLAALTSAPGEVPHEALPLERPASTMVKTTTRLLPGAITETRSVVLPVQPAAPELGEVWAGAKNGNVGPEVQTIQKRLQSLGFDVAVNSTFDARTEKAVKQFQREMGVPVSGVVDEATLKVLAFEPGAGLAHARALAGDASTRLASAADREAKVNVAEKGENAVGYCAKHVRLALEQCELGPGGGKYAHQYGEALAKRDNMTEIVGLSVADLDELPAGAIIVYGNSAAHPSGHVTVVSHEQTVLGERLESSDHQQVLGEISHSTSYGNTFAGEPHETRFRVFMPTTTTVPAAP